MRARTRPRLTYANVVSTLCLFIVLGGSAAAVSRLPKDSVGARQLKTGAVGSKEIKKGAVAASDLKKNAIGAGALRQGSVKSSEVEDRSLTAIDFAAGQIPKGAKGDRGPAGLTNLITRLGTQTVCSTDGCSIAAEATCEPGERAVGGAGFTVGDNYLTESGPSGGTNIPGSPGQVRNPTKWRVVFKDVTAGPDAGSNATGHVVCASP